MYNVPFVILAQISSIFRLASDFILAHLSVFHGNMNLIVPFNKHKYLWLHFQYVASLFVVRQLNAWVSPFSFRHWTDLIMLSLIILCEGVMQLLRAYCGGVKEAHFVALINTSELFVMKYIEFFSSQLHSIARFTQLIHSLVNSTLCISLFSSVLMKRAKKLWNRWKFFCFLCTWWLDDSRSPVSEILRGYNRITLSWGFLRNVFDEFDGTLFQK